MKQKAILLVAVISAVYTTSAFAAVSADEAKQLGGTLTLFGAEVAGNKEGTIPAYEGQTPKAPAGWNRKKHGYPDPWNEKPLFSITAQNAAQYADKIDGMMEMFKKFPNFRMDIYPSHRTVTYPKHILDSTVKNATACKGTNDELNLVGCYGAIPFPIPKSGRQEMWNHLLGVTAVAATSQHLQTWVTPNSGGPVLQSTLDIYSSWPIFQASKAASPMSAQELYYKARVDFIGPARQVGTKLVLFYSVDTLGYGSRVWQYIPGQRRVKLAPDLAYDTPSPTSGGAATMDEQQGFLDALDRYDFKLVGKKEKYIMYNNYTLTDPRVCPDTKVAASLHFADPDCVRWELHRVWKVEATLKPGFRHIYPKRNFYFDEDTHLAGATENFDAAGKLYRVGNMISYPFYDGGFDAQGLVITDLQTGTWTLQGGQGTEGGVFYPTSLKPDTFLSPEALAGEGIR